MTKLYHVCKLISQLVRNDIKSYISSMNSEDVAKSIDPAIVIGLKLAPALVAVLTLNSPATAV